MAFPKFDKNLSYAKIPTEYCHRREGLRNNISHEWEKIVYISDWENLNLQDSFVRSDRIRLIDPEIVHLSETERLSVIEYYTNNKKKLENFGSYIIRDNHNGKVFLPQDCYVFCVLTLLKVKPIS